MDRRRHLAGRGGRVVSVAAPKREQLLASAGEWNTTDERFSTLWQQALDVEGWLSEGQARTLYRAASLVPPGHWIVEVGSHHGRSTVFLAAAKPADVSMLAVDPFDNPRWGGGPESYARFDDTLERFRLSDHVQAFRGVSAEASSQWDSSRSIGLVFINGAHDRASVIADVDGWEQHVAPGGLVIFHDAFSSVGVTQALTERHLLSRRFRCLGAHRSLVVFRRQNLDAAETFRSAARLAVRYPYFARNLAIKLSLRRGLRRLPNLLRYRPGDDLL